MEFVPKTIHKHMTTKACIAVYFIDKYQVPVFSALHFQGKGEQINKMDRKKSNNIGSLMPMTSLEKL